MRFFYRQDLRNQARYSLKKLRINCQLAIGDVVTIPQHNFQDQLKSIVRKTLLFGAVAVLPISYAHPASAQITSCSYGELFEFENSSSIVFTADPSNAQLFTASSMQNGQTFDFTILDRSPLSNPLPIPITGTTHSQTGGNVTNGAIR